MHREADMALAKARETMERAPHVQVPLSTCSVPHLNQAPPAYPASPPSTTPPVPPPPPVPPARSLLAAQRKRDYSLGQSAPNLSTYTSDAGMPRSSPRPSPMSSPRPTPFSTSQDLHFTAPNMTRVSANQLPVRRLDSSPGAGPTRTSPMLTSRVGRTTPSSSPVQHDRQGRNVPSTFPQQGYAQTQTQVPQTRRMPGYSWMQPQQTGHRY